MPRYQVLLVDDNAMVRRIVRHVLEKDPELNICGEADDGFEAMDKAKLVEARHRCTRLLDATYEWLSHCVASPGCATRCMPNFIYSLWKS